MKRRTFIKLLSMGTLGVGGAVYGLSRLESIVNRIPPPYGGDETVMDRIAFTETVYPFFDFDKLAETVETINSREAEWRTIESTFFSFFYRNHDQRFYTFPVRKRIPFVVDFIDSCNRSGQRAMLADFDDAKRFLMLHVIENGPYPCSAYGYPDKKSLPFMADPSWSEYHLNPETLLRRFERRHMNNIKTLVRSIGLGKWF